MTSVANYAGKVYRGSRLLGLFRGVDPNGDQRPADRSYPMVRQQRNSAHTPCEYVYEAGSPGRRRNPQRIRHLYRASRPVRDLSQLTLGNLNTQGLA